VTLRRTSGMIVAAAILGSAFASSADSPALCPSVTWTSTTATTAAARTVAPVADFDAFVAEAAGTMLARFPEDVTDLGLSTLLSQRDDRLNDLSHSYRLETARLAQDALGRMATVDLDALTRDQRITFAVSEWYLGDIVAMADYLDHEYAVNYITGAHANFPEFMADVHPITNGAQADAYVERLRGSAIQMRQVADNLSRSNETGSSRMPGLRSSPRCSRRTGTCSVWSTRRPPDPTARRASSTIRADRRTTKPPFATTRRRH